MPSESPADEGRAGRLHPTSLLFSIGSAARRLILPGLVLLLFSRGRNPEIWLMVLFVPTAIAAVAKYLTFRYRLGAEELMIREGVLTRNERHIPYARIQNVDVTQNPFHRWLGVAQVRIETAGGDEPEANIQVLSVGAVERMRSRVFRDRAPGTLPAPAGAAPVGGTAEVTGASPAASPSASRRDVLSLPLRELVLYGVISNRGLAVVLAAWGLAWQAHWQGWAPDWFEELMGSLGDVDRVISDAGGSTSPWVIGLYAVGALLLFVLTLRLFSIVWAIVKLYGFSLTRTGDNLRATYGLFTRRTTTTPRHRVQLLTVRTTPLHRWFGRAEVKVETAGGGKREEDASVSRQLLAPLVPEERLAGLLAEIQPEARLDGLVWQRVHPRAWRRMLFKLMLLISAIAVIATVSTGPSALLGLIFALPGAVVAARLRYKRMQYALGTGFVAYRSGILSRRLSVARFTKIQVVDLDQTPFDRRVHMATVRIDTAGAGPTGHRIRVPYLGLDVAREIFRRLSLEAARTEFRW
jgi:putative membrane protein